MNHIANYDDDHHSVEGSVSPQQQIPNTLPQGQVNGGPTGIPPVDNALTMQLLQQVLIMNQNAIAQPLPRETGFTLEKLKKNGAGDFLGEDIANPLIAFRWLERAQRVFQNLKVPAGDRANLAVMLLQSHAYEWWKRTTRKENHPEKVTWTYFEEVFREEYIPESFVEDKREEFAALKMNDMSLPEYRQLFDHLAEFGQDLVNNTKRRCDKFIKGMRPDLQTGMATATRLNFADMYEQAKEVVRTSKGLRQYREQNPVQILTEPVSASKAPSSKRPLSEPSTPPPKKAKSLTTESATSSYNRMASKFPRCDSCGGHHPGECWKTLGLCMGCGQPGHFRRNCPTNPGPAFPTALAPSQTQVSNPAQSQRTTAGSRLQRPQQQRPPQAVAQQQGRVPARTYAMQGRIDPDPDDKFGMNQGPEDQPRGQ